jgi:hypothetical protein
MNPNATQNRDREEQLGAVLAEWLEAAEQGQPPDENDYLRRYPEFGSELAQCFADWKRFPRPKGAVQRSGVMPEAQLAENGQLGDFRIVRQVGRHGHRLRGRAGLATPTGGTEGAALCWRP